MLRILLIAFILVPMFPATAAGSCPPAASETSVAYATIGDDRYYGVRVLGHEYRENTFIWPNGVGGDTWLETNGLDGLQTTASACGPADSRVAGASAGVGRPAIIV